MKIQFPFVLRKDIQAQNKAEVEKVKALKDKEAERAQALLRNHHENEILLLKEQFEKDLKAEKELHKKRYDQYVSESESRIKTLEEINDRLHNFAIQAQNTYNEYLFQFSYVDSVKEKLYQFCEDILIQAGKMRANSEKLKHEIDMERKREEKRSPEIKRNLTL